MLVKPCQVEDAGGDDDSSEPPLIEDVQSLAPVPMAISSDPVEISLVEEGDNPDDIQSLSEGAPPTDTSHSSTSSDSSGDLIADVPTVGTGSRARAT